MSSVDRISPSVIKRISKEIQSLSTNPPEGILIIVNENNITDIQAWIQGPEGTPYECGSFRVKLVLSPDFPGSPPKCFFLTKIFHPNVSKSGEVCVNTLKKDWKQDLGIVNILLTVKCLLIVPNPESALNEEAGKLLLERYEDYAKHARVFTSIHASSNKSIFHSSSTAASTFISFSSSSGPSNHLSVSNSSQRACSPRIVTNSNAIANTQELKKGKDSVKELKVEKSGGENTNPSPNLATKKRLAGTEKGKVEKKKIDIKKRGLKRL